MEDAETIVTNAIVFVVLFLVGGFIGFLVLPPFVGRFYISGLIFAAFGTKSGILKLSNR